MFLAIDHMRKVRVRALSPDKSVTAIMSAEGGIRVELELGCLSRHSVHSLAREVRAAVSGVLDAYRGAGDEIMRRQFESGALEAAMKTETGQRLQPFLNALDRITVAAVGPKGLAKTGLVEGRFRVAFRPGALELRESELCEEIMDSLTIMYDRRSSAAARLYDELLVTPEAER